MTGKGLARLLVLTAAAAALPSLVALSVPLRAIRGNSHLIHFQPTDLRFSLLCFLLASLAILAALVLAGRSRQPGVLAFLAACTVALLLADAIDARFWLSSVAAVAAAGLVELAVFGGVFVLAARAPAELPRLALAFFAAVNVLFGLLGASGLAAELQPAAAGELPAPSRLDAPAAVGGNVYHLVLDAFNGSYLDYRLRQGRAPDLPGFTFWPNTSANFGRTNTSMRSVFQGSLLLDDFTGEAAGAFTGGFADRLQRRGVALAYFPFYGHYCHPAALVCDDTIGLYNRSQAAGSRRFLDDTIGLYNRSQAAGSRHFLVDTMFLRALPAAVRSVVSGSLRTEQRPTDRWEVAFSVSRWWRRLRSAGSPLAPWEWPIQTHTLLTFERFLEAEPDLPARGRYTFVHLMLPHAPYAVDPRCAVDELDREHAVGTLRALEDQSDCALHLVERLATRLRELGRYQDSLIVVHSDHGSMWHRCSEWATDFPYDLSLEPADRNVVDAAELPTAMIACLSDVLLLVKLPRQQDFRSVAERRQLIDVAPTILDYYRIGHDLEGLSLFAEAPASRRPVYFETTSNETARIDRLGRFVQDDGVWRFDRMVAVGDSAER